MTAAEAAAEVAAWESLESDAAALAKYAAGGVTRKRPRIATAPEASAAAEGPAAPTPSAEAKSADTSTASQVPAAKRSRGQGARSAADPARAGTGASASPSDPAGGTGGGSLAFRFEEGPLVTALRDGGWILLDEANLAPADVLNRILPLLEGRDSSLTLVERGDSTALPRHPAFRLFAAMNPATDVGKRPLPQGVRQRFHEVWVDEPTSVADLSAVAVTALAGAEAAEEAAATTAGGCVVARGLKRPVAGADGPRVASDVAAGALARCLRATARLSALGFKPWRSVLEAASAAYVGQVSDELSDAPLLLEGPTSAGKTTIVSYLAAAAGHNCVRINNHANTEAAEYTGGFAPAADGAGLVFREGLLVTAARRGDWLILDELNLAPSEVLESLNRLLDDNRAIRVPETGEVVRPHPLFRVFATQNPAGAGYGGRQRLSRAFRSRFFTVRVGVPLPPRWSPFCGASRSCSALCQAHGGRG
ncbi:hypothetical protein FNF29_07850 [Cafeteria roenbergensis]|uniref:Midasin n=1 Tax=Cafeteria roenbergensis TaxID=33653 RepID=A0A5A8C2K1_CAFRO|nr:hypothetical protein FNF29_07850 [Cafeteria roenbergensis]|eukprot:KAA0146729.1 hypothetical protein FNF29_07850 [Cafeteria roenbergensis]